MSTGCIHASLIRRRESAGTSAPSNHSGQPNNTSELYSFSNTTAEIEIPRERWRAELDSFSRQHEGWIVDLLTVSDEGHQTREAHDLPLEGVSTISLSATPDIAISLGQEPGNHLTHEVRNPTAVAVERTEDGVERALRIRARDGTTTTLKFRSPMRPEEVDGIIT